MKVGIIDADMMWTERKRNIFGNVRVFPNIVCMKIAAYHRNAGDSVEWYNGIEKYDRVYISRVFTATPMNMEVVQADEVFYGGSGFNITMNDGKEVFGEPAKIAGWTYWNELPHEIEHVMPCYDMYPHVKGTAYGFLSRGCPRGCSFCHVAAKEGRRAYKVADLNEWWDGQKDIMICDPNILACREWRDLLAQLADSKANVEINQGFDARLLTDEKVQYLNAIKLKNVHFAWDRYEEKDAVLRGLRLFADGDTNGVVKGGRNCVFVLCNYDTTMDQDLERIYTLRDMGYLPYVMVYDAQHAPKQIKMMKRWCNLRKAFKACPSFDDYKKGGDR